MRSIRFAALTLAVVAIAVVSAITNYHGMSDGRSSDISGELVSSVENRTAESSAQDIDASKVVGREACAACHDREIDAWAASAHNTKAFGHLEGGKGAEFGEELGIDDVTTSDRCVRCHGTKRVEDGAVIIDQGNSCESCHGASGGDDGWLHAHYDYGLGAENMEQMIEQRMANEEDPAHRAERLGACFRGGMNRAEDVMAIVQNCLDCHAVPDPELVAIGHPSTEDFEIVAYSQGEVRHNFLLDRETNSVSPSGWLASAPRVRTPESRKRMMFVVGQLVDLAFSLRLRATITEEGDYLDQVEGRLKGAMRNLRKISGNIEDALEEGEEVPLGQEFVDMYEEVKDNDDFDEITDDDAELYSGLAEMVNGVTRGFVGAHRDGDLLPESIDDDVPEDDDAIGDIYNP